MRLSAGWILPLLIAVAALAAIGIRPDVAAAAPCDPPIQNEIVCENSKPGNPASEWDDLFGGPGNDDLNGGPGTDQEQP